MVRPVGPKGPGFEGRIPPKASKKVLECKQRVMDTVKNIHLHQFEAELKEVSKGAFGPFKKVVKAVSRFF